MTERGAEDGAPAAAGALPWLIWSLAGLFFAFGFFQRVAPSVMVSDLMRDFGVTATVLGNLSAFYFYAYASMQLPVGLVVDHWGPRLALSGGALLCGTGTLLFAVADTLPPAYFGRLLIGAGAGFAFVSTMKLAGNWFPPARFALVSGFTSMVGMAGAIIGQAPLAAVVGVFGWRDSLAATAAFGLALAVVIWLLVRDGPAPSTPAEPSTPRRLVHGLRQVLSTGQSWAAAIYAATLAANMSAFAVLWGVPYMIQAHGLARPVAAASISLIMLGWGIGAPLAGWYSDRIRLRKPPMLAAAIAASAAFVALVYIPGLPLVAAEVLLLVIGMTTGTMHLGFVVGREHNRPAASGTAISFVNTFVMGTGAAFQPLIGWLLDLNWDGRMEAGAPVYGTDAFRIALLPLVASGIIGILAVFLIRETHARQT